MTALRWTGIVIKWIGFISAIPGLYILVAGERLEERFLSRRVF